MNRVRISDCPAAVNSIMARSKEAIARLDEKALRGGGKSEDQPFSVICLTTLDVRACGETIIFVGNNESERTVM